MAETKIEWTDFTFNPWIGCSKVAPGCEHCYAEADMDKRRGRVKWGPHGTRSKTSDDYWKQPLKWNRQAADGVCVDCGSPLWDTGDCDCGQIGATHQVRRPRVFCASLADVFEDWEDPILDHRGDVILKPYLDSERHLRCTCPPEQFGHDMQGWRQVTMADLRRDLFALIDSTPHLDWLLLTKRPENVRRMWPVDGLDIADDCEIDDERRFFAEGELRFRRSNVWLGCSISEQETADDNIPELLKCRDLAAVLFVSYEPALGPVDFGGWLTKPQWGKPDEQGLMPHEVVGRNDLVNWMIVGGESGPKARTCDVAWIRSAVEQCDAAGVPCFVKQLGGNIRDRNDAGFDGNESDAWDFGGFDPDDFIEHHPNGYLEHYQGAPVRIRLRHRKGGDPAEWPEDLRVRQFPNFAEFASK